MRELFKLRNYRIYLLGSTIDTIGDMAFFLAAAIWVKELTGSTAEAGLPILCVNVGTLLSPFTGILVDRLPRRRTLMALNVIIALFVLSLTTVHRASQVWLIALVMFVYGITGDIAYSAFNGLKEQLMPKALFGDAEGLNQAIQQGMRLITPAIGLGLLAAFGGPALALMDVATFVVALVMWSLIKVDDRRPPRPEVKQSWREESTAGLRFVLRSPLLLQLTLACGVGIFAMGFFEVLGIAIATVGLHHSATWVGVMVTAMGISGLAGGLLAGRFMKRLGSGMLTALGLLIVGLAAFAVAVPNQYVVIAASVVFGFGLPLIIVGTTTAIQLYTPNALMGRVSGVMNLVITGMQCLGIAVCAWLIADVFYRDLCYFVAVTMCVSAICLGTRPAQWKRNLPALETVEGPEAAAMKPSIAGEAEPTLA